MYNDDNAATAIIDADFRPMPLNWSVGRNGANGETEAEGLTAPVLRLTLHLASGNAGARRLSLIQGDPADAAHVLEQLRPERLFARHHLLFSGGGAATAVPTGEVERVDVEATWPLPLWPFPQPGVAAVEEVTEAEFHRVRRSGPPPPERVLGRLVAVLPRRIALRVRLRGGAEVFLRVRLRPETPAAPPSAAGPVAADASLFLTHLFSRPVLFGRALDGRSLFLLNPANVAGFTVTPAPEGMERAGAWPMADARWSGER